MRKEQKIGPYVIKDVLGAGGMATVYHAIRSTDELVVALKVLAPNLAHIPTSCDRFKAEAEVMQRLRHPNIVEVYEYLDEEAAIAMEYVRGSTLEELIESRGAFPPPEAVHCILPILEAIGYAHQRGVLHRDLKPSNIMLATRGDRRDPVVLDFGLAKVLGDGPQRTRTGARMGTLHYMSPEQHEGNRVGAASDIYAIGITLYELMTGLVPFTGNSDLDIIRAHIRRRPKPPGSLRSEIGPALDEVVLKAIAKNPIDRFRNTKELSQALTRALENQAQRSDVILNPKADRAQPRDTVPKLGKVIDDFAEEDATAVDPAVWHETKEPEGTIVGYRGAPIPSAYAPQDQPERAPSDLLPDGKGVEVDRGSNHSKSAGEGATFEPAEGRAADEPGGTIIGRPPVRAAGDHEGTAFPEDREGTRSQNRGAPVAGRKKIVVDPRLYQAPDRGDSQGPGHGPHQDAVSDHPDATPPRPQLDEPLVSGNHEPQAAAPAKVNAPEARIEQVFEELRSVPSGGDSWSAQSSANISESEGAFPPTPTSEGVPARQWSGGTGAGQWSAHADSVRVVFAESRRRVALMAVAVALGVIFVSLILYLALSESEESTPASPVTEPAVAERYRDAGLTEGRRAATKAQLLSGCPQVSSKSKVVRSDRQKPTARVAFKRVNKAMEKMREMRKALSIAGDVTEAFERSHYEMRNRKWKRYREEIMRSRLEATGKGVLVSLQQIAGTEDVPENLYDSIQSFCRRYRALAEKHAEYSKSFTAWKNRKNSENHPESRPSSSDGKPKGGSKPPGAQRARRRAISRKALEEWRQKQLVKGVRACKNNDRSLARKIYRRLGRKRRRLLVGNCMYHGINLN
jgi:serine/threonine protein kinase